MAKKKEITIVSWNMALGSPGKARGTLDKAWDFVLRQDVDIALLQETRIQNNIPSDYHVKWESANQKQNWGSAILSRFPHAADFDIGSLNPGIKQVIHSFKGRNIAAKYKLDDDRNLLLVSAHTSSTRIDKRAISSKALKLLLDYPSQNIWQADALFECFIKLPKTNQRFIVGGDFNTSRLFNDPIFDYARQAEIVECFREKHPEELRTWFRNENRHHQLDHFFSDKRTASGIIDCWVNETPAHGGLSDHAPIFMKFEI